MQHQGILFSSNPPTALDPRTERIAGGGRGGEGRERGGRGGGGGRSTLEEEDGENDTGGKGDGGLLDEIGGTLIPLLLNQLLTPHLLGHCSSQIDLG